MITVITLRKALHPIHRGRGFAVSFLVALALLASGCVAQVVTEPGPIRTSAGPSSVGSASSAVRSPSVATTSIAPAELRFPPGLDEANRGLIYVESLGSVAQIDVNRRTVRHILTPRLDRFRNFVATSTALVSRHVADDQGFLVTANGELRELPAQLRGPGRVYSAGGNALWVIDEEASNGKRLIVRYNFAAAQLNVTSRHAIADEWGIPASDHAGLLLVGQDMSWVVCGTKTKRLRGWRPVWEFLGIGRTAMLVKPCARCHAELRNRRASDDTRRATPRGLRAVERLLSRYDHWADGHLSSNGRRLALSVTQNNLDRDARIAAIDLVTGKSLLLPGTKARFNANDQYTWLDDRLLLAVTDHTLRIFDAEKGEVHTWRSLYVDRVAATS